MRDNMISTADPNGIFTFNSLSDYLTNRPFSLTIAIPGTTSPRDLRQTLFAAYFQDDLRLRSNLTANVGTTSFMTRHASEFISRAAKASSTSSSSRIPTTTDCLPAFPQMLVLGPRLFQRS